MGEKGLGVLVVVVAFSHAPVPKTVLFGTAKSTQPSPDNATDWEAAGTRDFGTFLKPACILGNPSRHFGSNIFPIEFFTSKVSNRDLGHPAGPNPDNSRK
jgi:hypothetical protein